LLSNGANCTVLRHYVPSFRHNTGVCRTDRQTDGQTELLVWQPLMRQMDEIGETRSILGNRIPQRMAGTAERICAKFTQKTCLSFAHTSVNVKIKSQSHQEQKTHCALRTLPQY